MKKLNQQIALATLLLDSNQYSAAERIFNEALARAEARFGESAEAGLVLVGLHTLYEKQGREEEATKTWRRLRRIILQASSLRLGQAL